MSRFKMAAALSILLTCFQPGSAFSEEDRRGKPQKSRVSIDFSKPPRADHRLLPGLFFGLKSEISYEFEKSFDLNSEKPDNQGVFEPAISLSLRYAPSEKVSAYANFESSYLLYHDERKKKVNEDREEIKEAFIRFENVVADTLLKIGRQRIRDNREWLLDDELDAVRILYVFPVISLDVFFGREKGGFEGKKGDRASYYQVSGKLGNGKREAVKLYWVKKSSQQEELNFYGANYNGKLKRGLTFRMEYALLRGESGKKNISGSALDTGVTFRTGLPAKHTFSAGYAFGSGDDESATLTDTGFRQTGLQDNNARVNGMTRVKYYGEVFDPELSNLSVFSLSSGVRPTSDFSLEILFHSFSQVRTSKNIRDSGLNETPDGVNRFLGREIDMVAGLRFRRDIRASIVTGRFFPGRAFKKSSTEASYFEFKFAYTF